jgi:hypothetical protein
MPNLIVARKLDEVCLSGELREFRETGRPHRLAIVVCIERLHPQKLAMHYRSAYDVVVSKANSPNF